MVLIKPICRAGIQMQTQRMDLQTQRAGSWLSGEGVRVTVDRASFGVLECSGTRL